MKFRTIIETEIPDGTSIGEPDEIIMLALNDFRDGTGIWIDPKIIHTEVINEE
jgi:hypothetical protein